MKYSWLNIVVKMEILRTWVSVLSYIPSVVALLVMKIDVYEQLVSHINRSIRLGVFISVSFE